MSIRHGSEEKANRYINELNAVRLNGNHSQLPELARKIEKHAPQRRCLYTTARAEAHIAGSRLKQQITALADSSNISPNQLATQLLDAIREETRNPRDILEAQVCLGEIYWEAHEPLSVIERLPRNLDYEAERLELDWKTLQCWTQVCIFKGAFIKSAAQERLSSKEAAVDTLQSVIPYIRQILPAPGKNVLLYRWIERILGKLCAVQHQKAIISSYSNFAEAREAFALWEEFWQYVGRSTGEQHEGRDDGTRRRHVWKAYYDLLSWMLRHLPTEGLDPREKIRLSKTVKNVQIRYETLLLQQTQFPKATDRNEEVEEWVKQAIGNWKILCGGGWSDMELGEGGREGTARETLEVLYRAATKTFHSTQILRHLFTVHSYLGEFDIAMRAVNTYLEIVNKAQAREEKSGKRDAAIDNEDMIVRTAAQAIRICCQYGARDQYEKAREIGEMIEKWVGSVDPDHKAGERVVDPTASSGYGSPIPIHLSPQTFAIGYRAIGTSQAQWARVTYESASRATWQQQAIENLEKSLTFEPEDQADIESLYALALILAETRDIIGAITRLDQALHIEKRQNVSSLNNGAISDSGREPLCSIDGSFEKERHLLSTRHLLALLLSARQDFEPALRACEGALEQFIDPANLFGDDNSNSASVFGRSFSKSFSTTNEKTQNSTSKGLVDYMEFHEKECIVQIKMTQLSLLEIVEGPDFAVNASEELFALYSRLFGGPRMEDRGLRDRPLKPPKSASGTLRSIKGSIFRRKSKRMTLENGSTLANKSITTIPSTVNSRPTTQQGRVPDAPTIQVTDEGGTVDGEERDEEKRHHHHLLNSHRDRPQSQPEGMETSDINYGENEKTIGEPSAESEFAALHSKLNRSTEFDRSLKLGAPRTEVSSMYSIEAPNAAGTQDLNQSTGVDASEEQPGQPLRSIPHGMHHNAEPRPAGHADQPPVQDTRLPVPAPHTDHTPQPRLQTTHERRQKVSLLIQIWLFTARLYATSAMYDDAREATNEAFKLVRSLDIELSQAALSTTALPKSGLGIGPAVDALWADVWSRNGDLYSVQEQPHEAMSCFEKALQYCPDHPSATIGLSHLLLDIYEQKIPFEPAELKLEDLPPHNHSNSSTSSSFLSDPPPSSSSSSSSPPSLNSSLSAPANNNSIPEPTPNELNRLAARDRAYGLLFNLTRLGQGWDDSEAWYALARAYELSSMPAKAKECLWWCVELEESRPVRAWNCLKGGGSSVS